MNQIQRTMAALAAKDPGFMKQPLETRIQLASDFNRSGGKVIDPSPREIRLHSYPGRNTTERLCAYLRATDATMATADLETVLCKVADLKNGNRVKIVDPQAQGASPGRGAKEERDPGLGLGTATGGTLDVSAFEGRNLFEKLIAFAKAEAEKNGTPLTLEAAAARAHELAREHKVIDSSVKQ